MFRLKTLTLAMTAAVLLAGCTSTQESPHGAALEIRPFQETQHGQDKASALYQLGRYYHGQMRYEQALAAYRKARAIEPQNVDVLTGIGVVHASLGEYEDALRAFRSAAALQPDSPQTLNNLGYIHWLRKETAQAVDAYRRALVLDPKNERARQNLRLASGESSPAAAIAPVQAKAVEQPVNAGTGASRSSIALKEVSPQVFELTLPASATAVATQAVAPAAAPHARPSTTKLATAPAKPTAGGGAVAAGASKAGAAPAAVAGVEVLNGNGIKGVAKETADKLAARGYAIAAVGNHHHHRQSKTVIEHLPGQAEQARKLAQLISPNASVVEAKSLGGQGSIRVVLGRDVGSASAKAPASVEAQAGQLGVANGNGVNGMARKVARHLADHGYKATRVYNLRPFDKAITRIEYRKGHEGQALKLGNLLPVKVAYAESNAMRGDVRLILGHDMKQNMAVWARWLDGIRLAESGPAGQI